MRAVAMVVMLSVAVPCYAEDPLETLNTVADTISTMEQTLKMRGENKDHGRFALAVALTETLPVDDTLFFVADEGLEEKQWVEVKPCTDELAEAQAAAGEQSCVRQPDGTVVMGAHHWRSRPAKRDDLRVGALVVTKDDSGGWILTTISDVSELPKGFVAVPAPVRPSVRGLRIVE